jgi:hypothetical protein
MNTDKQGKLYCKEIKYIITGLRMNKYEHRGTKVILRKDDNIIT